MAILTHIFDLYQNQSLNNNNNNIQVDYTPTSEHDYGNLLCWAQNSIGVQVLIFVMVMVMKL